MADEIGFYAAGGGAAPVTSVAGKVGDVSLAAADVSGVATLDGSGHVPVGELANAVGLVLGTGLTVHPTTGLLTWGADTTLYRSAADYLTTDDSLDVLGQYLRVAPLTTGNARSYVGGTDATDTLLALYAKAAGQVALSMFIGGTQIWQDYVLGTTSQYRYLRDMPNARMHMWYERAATAAAAWTHFASSVEVEGSLRADGVITFGATGPNLATQASTPEGSLDLPKGSALLRSDAAPYLYLKTTASGVNTGWVPALISTGLVADATTGALTWSADTNLYRSGANILATDDSLRVDGATVTVGDQAGVLATVNIAGETGAGQASQLNLRAATDGSGNINYFVAGTAAWKQYLLGAAPSVLYLRDMTNSKMHVTYTAGAGTGGTTEINSALKVLGNAGFYGATPVTQRSLTGVVRNGLNGGGLVSLGVLLAQLGLVSGTMPSDGPVTVIADYTTATNNENVFLLNGVGVTLTLMSPSGFGSGNRMILRNIHATAATTVKAPGATTVIDGANSIVVGPGETAWLYSDGTSYYRTGRQVPGISTAAAGVTEITGAAKIDGNVGFYNTAPAGRPTVTGSRTDGTALASLLTGLASLGLITDSSTA